jgi:MFS family permease
MRAPLAPIAPVLLGVLIAEVALGMLTTLIPLSLSSRGIMAGTIGLVGSGYFLGFLIGTLTCARLVRAVGHIRAFAVFAALGADCALLMTTTHSPWVWAGLRLIMGWQMSGLFLVAESWLNDKADSTTRGRTFGAYLLISWGGAAAGPLAFGLLRSTDTALIMVGVAFASALLPMALSPVSNPPLGERRRLSLVRLYSISPMGMTCVIASGFFNSSFYTLVPVYLERHGYGLEHVPIFLSAALIAALLVQYPVGMASDRFGRRPMTVASLGLAVVISILLAVCGAAPFWMLIVLGCLLSGVTAPLYGLGAGQTNDRVSRGDYVAASGGLLFAWALGSTVGPLASGAVMARAGANSLFAFLAVALLLLSGFTLLRIRRSASVPNESSFVVASRAPTLMPELNPQTPEEPEANPDSDSASHPEPTRPRRTKFG